MFEIWGRRRDNLRYEFLWSFDDENQKFFMIDQVDSTIYSEVMIVKNNKCIAYVENKDYTPYSKVRK